MRRPANVIFATLALAILPLAGCMVNAREEATPAPTTKESAPTEGPFDAQLRDIAKKYRSFGLASDLANWAPVRCRAMPGPSSPEFSGSKDTGSHGQKLYFLFAKEQGAYLQLASLKEAPVGQVLVKEAWVPEEIKPDGQPRQANLEELLLPPNTTPFAFKDGKRFAASRRGDLFVMFKMDPKTPGTDNGWVYGTLTPDGAKVTSAGRVESCMKCHEQAANDRQLGLPVAAKP